MTHSKIMSIVRRVRQALDAARRRQPVGEVGKKLEQIRTAARYDFPSGDLGPMLADIERGYIGNHR